MAADGSESTEAELTLAAQLAELASRPLEDTRIGRLRARTIDWAQRATTWGPLGPVAEIGWRTMRRDASIGGSVLGGALAYRLFIWLLPLALALVLGVGIAANTGGESTASIIRDAGLTGFIASSIADSSERAHGWAAVAGLGGALFVLLWQTSALFRSVRAVTALAWGQPVRRLPKPARATFLFLGWMLLFVLVVGSASPIRSALPFPLDALASLLAYALIPVLFLALSWWLLPHAADDWHDLVPGSVLFGACVAVIGLFTGLVLFPWLAEREETYGILGIAAGLLFAFFLFGRVVEVAAALNAELLESRRRRLAR